MQLQAPVNWFCPSAVCNRVLPGPEAAVRAASGGGKKSDAEALLHRAVNDALHLLSLLRLVLALPRFTLHNQQHGCASFCQYLLCSTTRKVVHSTQEQVDPCAEATLSSASSLADFAALDSTGCDASV